MGNSTSSSSKSAKKAPDAEHFAAREGKVAALDMARQKQILDDKEREESIQRAKVKQDMANNKDKLIAQSVTVNKPPNTSGYLTKEGQKTKSWKRRFFVLQDGVLSYYEREKGTGTGVGETKIGESLTLRHYQAVANGSKNIIISHRMDSRMRVLNVEAPDTMTRDFWISGLNHHITYLDTLYNLLDSKKESELESAKCIDEMTQWIKQHAKHVLSKNAHLYAQLFYSNNVGHMDRVAKKITRNRLWMVEAGVEVDDSEDIIQALLNTGMITDLPPDPTATLSSNPPKIGSAGPKPVLTGPVGSSPAAKQVTTNKIPMSTECLQLIETMKACILVLIDINKIVNTLERVNKFLQESRQNCEMLGQSPDVIPYILTFLKSHKNNVSICGSSLLSLTLLCRFNDDKIYSLPANIVNIAANGGLEVIVDTIKSNFGDASLVTVGMKAIAYTSYGNSSNIQAYGTLGACEIIVKACNVYLKDPRVLENSCSAMAILVSNSANTTKLYNANACGAVVHIVKSNQGNLKTMEAAIETIQNMCSTHDDSRNQYGTNGAIEVLVATMISNSQHGGVAEFTCGSIAHLAYNNDANRIKAAAIGACEAIIALMKTHSGSSSVLEQATWAIYHLSFNYEIKARLIHLQALDLVTRIATNTSMSLTCRSNAKEARDKLSQV